MRLSGLVIAAILLVSATLLAQHSSGASGSGGASSGGSSHGSSGYSGGSSSSVSSHVSSTSTRISAGTSSAAKAGSNARTGAPQRTSNAQPEKKSHFSFLRHKKPVPKPVAEAEFKPIGCKKGQICRCPGGGTPNAAGACVPQQVACPMGQGWSGFGCGAQYWFRDCSALAEQLARQKEQMRGQNDYGQSLRYRLLQQQYEQCLMRSRSPFGAYAFNALLLDTP